MCIPQPKWKYAQRVTSPAHALLHQQTRRITNSSSNYVHN